MGISLFVNLISKNGQQKFEVTPAIADSKSEYEAMREAFVGTASIVPQQHRMTGRQLQILEGMIEGKTNFEIASELGYSVSTVRQETIKIYQILNVTGRRAAAQEALRQKIV